MKKVIMMVLCLGQVAMMYAPAEMVYEDVPKYDNDELQRPKWYHFRARRAYDHFMRERNNGTVPTHSSNSMVARPVDSATAVTGAGGSDVALLQNESVEDAAIIAEGKPTVSFADQVRSVFGHRFRTNAFKTSAEFEHKTFNELNDRLKVIEQDIENLRVTLGEIPLKEKNLNLRISNMIIRLSEEKKLLSKKLEDRFSPVETREEREEGKADIEADIEAIKNSRKPFFMKAYNKTSEEADEFLRKDEAEEAKKRAEHSRQKHELKERIKSYKNTWPDDFRQEYPSDYNDYELPGKPTLKQYGSFSSEA